MSERLREYEYELWRGDRIISTGYLQEERELAVGDRIRIAGEEGIVRSVVPTFAKHPARLVVHVFAR